MTTKINLILNTETIMYIQKIGQRYFIINTAGLIVKEFTSLAQAEQYLEGEMA